MSVIAGENKERGRLKPTPFLRPCRSSEGIAPEKILFKRYPYLRGTEFLFREPFFGA
jgi:hypothetical protein